MDGTMEDTLLVECLRCGSTRAARRTVWRHLDMSECPRCGYLGWAPTDELTENERRALRDRPLEGRRLLRVA
jgi:Zn ribbon nucleic-acid-binding protein